VRRLLLAIDEYRALFTHEPDKHGESDFRSITAVSEHRLAEKDVSQRHPVQATHQDAILIRFNRVAIAEAMQIDVCINDFRCDPSARLSKASSLSACSYDTIEGCINANPVHALR
jgi:hypothetical protein